VQRNASHAFDPYTWDVATTLSNVPSLVQVEACFGTTSTDTSPVCSAPQDMTYAPGDFGAASDTQSLGPGTFASLTGDYEIAAADAAVSTSLDGLSVGRTLTTLSPASASSTAGGVFGPGWTADLTGPQAGDATLVPVDQASKGYVLFTATDGATSTYKATTAVTAYPIQFLGTGESASDGEHVAKTDAHTVTMTDPDGTVTTWSNSSGVWRVVSVAEAGSNTTTTYTYNAAGLVTRILAPAPAGITCSDATADTTVGCRSLVLSYTTLTVSGVSVTRLVSISLSAPQVSGTPHSVQVATYDYNAAGQLADEYDPRISPHLLTTYTYGSSNRLATLTPPGQAAWNFAYDSKSRLSTVSRTDSGGATATSTIVYGVAFTGASAPVEVGAAADATWAQTADLPAQAVAVFPASHQPSSTSPSSVSSTDWPYASIDYLDVNGSQVNHAQYGAGAWQIDTTQYDGNGNVSWTLSAENRDQALTPTASTDTYVAGLATSAARAKFLAETNVFSPQDPSLLTDTYGPTHAITLSDGTVIDGQDHTHTDYDQGAPGGTTYDLQTTVTSTAYNDVTTTDTAFPDARITTYGYSAVGSMAAAGVTGWSLGEPTITTVQMGASPSSADLTTTDVYDAQGRPIEHRLPADRTASGAHSQDTTYYSATGTGTCVSVVSAGLVCQTAPASQPGSGSPLPTTTYTYDQFGDVATAVETAGSTTRTTTDTYDSAGRITHQSKTISPALGQALPAVTYAYDSATGLPTSATTGTGSTAQTISVGYDSLGRQNSYTDANGQSTATTYTLDGSPATVTTPVGTTTYTYGSSTEHRGLVTGEDIGVSGQPSAFQASYDGDGALVSETYPNGLVATTTHDDSGNPTRLSYAMGSSTWMTFIDTIGLSGNVVAQSSPGETVTNSYDGDGRLTSVNDTTTNSGGSTCTVRQYAFDAESNRTSEVTSAPAPVTCSTATTAGTQSGTFDAADRITNTGYTYDALGRTLTVPAADATSSSLFAGATGTLTLGYFANDMAATQTQGTWTMTYGLDPLQNRITTATATNGTVTSTTVNDYADNGDSPAWSSVNGSWTRDVTGPGGMLDATVAQSGTVTLQLTNLQGSEVATAADATTDTGIDTNSYASYDEYGKPISPAASTAIYGWEGGNERSTNSLGGLTLMGARLYDNTTGRFLTVDPVYGGNANPYIYPTDPINDSDVTGQMSVGSHRWWVQTANFFTWLQVIADGLAFLTLIFLPEFEGLVGAVALGITALAVVSTCVAYKWGSRACYKGWAFAALGLIMPAAGIFARLARAGRAAHSLLGKLDRLSSELTFMIDVYEKLRYG